MSCGRCRIPNLPLDNSTNPYGPPGLAQHLGQLIAWQISLATLPFRRRSGRGAVPMAAAVTGSGREIWQTWLRSRTLSAIHAPPSPLGVTGISARGRQKCPTLGSNLLSHSKMEPVRAGDCNRGLSASDLAWMTMMVKAGTAENPSGLADFIGMGLPLLRRAKQINFSVIRENGLSSNSWGVKASKQGDIYVFCRDHMKTMKISLHQSGQQFVAFTE